jgi:hypothetical protein
MKGNTMSQILAGRWARALIVAVPLALAGCADKGSPAPAPAAPAPPSQDTTGPGSAPVAKADADDSDLKAERAKLSPEDQKLVEAQEWCVINTTDRLGEMGPPIKVMVKDQPVFLCCSGCKKKAMADPDKTLAKVEELKAKAKAEKGKK